MNTVALDACLALARAHASLELKLDDALGTMHGLSWRDFTLLNVLATVPGEHLGLAALVRPLGLPPSGVVRRLAPLEKLGLVVREGGGSTPRRVALLPGGRRAWHEARETADAICAAALECVPAEAFSPTHLDALAESPALRL
jgi:DNA-binding MarR family transcriptional regulator